jgi:hypothetical protein
MKFIDEIYVDKDVKHVDDLKIWLAKLFMVKNHMNIMMMMTENIENTSDVKRWGKLK